MSDRNIYDRVIVLGVDGAGTFFKDTPTPHMDRIFKNGAVSYNVLTALPTISAECWGSMLHGVTPEIHRLTNGIVDRLPYDPCSPFPSLFRMIRSAYPDAALASFSCWNPINTGIIEENLNVYKDTAYDAPLTDKICDYVLTHDPKMLFVQFDEVDGAGHEYGYGSEQHLAQITLTDIYIGRIYDTYAARGFLDSTLFIVTADHGGTPPKDGHGGSHGGSTDAEKIVFWGAAGKTVLPGEIGEMEIRDNAAVCLWALGIKQPDTWTARVPDRLFCDAVPTERPVYTVSFLNENRTHKNCPTPSGLLSLIPDHRLLAYLPFDNTDVAAVGKTAVIPHGKRYFPEGFFGTGYKCDDGYLTLDDLMLGNQSFTAMLWIKTNGIVGSPILLANKSCQDRHAPGIYVRMAANNLSICFGYGSDYDSYDFPLPLDYRGGWMHLLLSLNREQNTVSLRMDFSAPITLTLSDGIRAADLSAQPLSIARDTNGIGDPLPAVLDELILMDGTADDGFVQQLCTYYNA